MPSPVFLAHFSDTHLGYEAYPKLSAAGNNQRGEDVVRAFTKIAKDIIDADPAIVIHSGDVADRPQVPIRYMLLVRKMFSDIAGLRPDGTRRQLVVIAGNHEQPRSHKEACFLELYRGIPGVHVVTNRYTQITFDDAGTPGGAAPELADVTVHGLPHDTLKDLAKTGGFDDVTPIPGRVNILTAHGVAGGSELFVRSLGREFAIPTDVLSRDWDYGALGHWHKQGPIALVSSGSSTADSEIGRVWYAGSSENMGFRDLRDNGTQRGWLAVTVTPGEVPAVERRNIAIRHMFRLPVLDVTGLAPEDIATALRDRIKAAEDDGSLSGAVAAQVVTGVTRDLWSLVDVTGVKKAAAAALHYEITVRFASAERDDDTSVLGGLGDLGTVLAERAAVVLTDSEREGAIALARDLLGDALAAGDPGNDTDEDDPETNSDDASTDEEQAA